MNAKTMIAESLAFPSADNSQPFRFRIVSDSEFEIFHDSARARHRLNHGNLASHLALGTLLESLRLVAANAGLGLKTKVTIPATTTTSGGEEPLERWARVEIAATGASASDADRELARALPLRVTDRRAYSRDPLSQADVRRLHQEASTQPALTFAFRDTLGRDAENLMLEIEEEQWKDLRAAADVFAWIRFNETKALETRDGMTWPSLALPRIQKPLLLLFQRVFPLYAFLVRFGATKGHRAMLKRQLRGTGGFGWIAVADADPETLVDAGRAYFRIWVYLCSRGHGFQPLSFATLPAFMKWRLSLPADWSAKLLSAYERLLPVLRAEAGFGPEVYPLWGFRTGHAPPFPAAARTLRKPVEELLIP